MQRFKSCTGHLPENNFVGLLVLTPPAPGHDSYSLKAACLTCSAKCGWRWKRSGNRKCVNWLLKRWSLKKNKCGENERKKRRKSRTVDTAGRFSHNGSNWYKVRMWIFESLTACFTPTLLYCVALFAAPDCHTPTLSCKAAGPANSPGRSLFPCEPGDAPAWAEGTGSGQTMSR